MVKQYSFFNFPLQIEAPELVPTPTPTPHPGNPHMQGPLLNLVVREDYPLPMMIH